jgi:hypothetical protein
MDGRWILPSLECTQKIFQVRLDLNKKLRYSRSYISVVDSRTYLLKICCLVMYLFGMVSAIYVYQLLTKK